MKPYYNAEGITIYHGDWREVLPELGKCSDLVVTSPPYNLKRQWWDQGSNGIFPDLAEKFTQGWYEDTMPEGEYQADQRKLLEACIAACRGSVCYNHKIRYAMKREGRAFHPMEWLIGLPLWSEIVWDRGGGVAHNSRRPLPVDERIYVFGRPLAWADLGYTSIWRVPARPQGFDHPCPFPLEIPRRLIACFTEPGQVVLDPYLGSGTTVRAAKDLGRRAIGIELNERYCEIAANRLSQEVLAL